MRLNETTRDVEAGCWLIADEDVEQNSNAAFTKSLSLHLLHQLPSETAASMPWRHIQRDDVTDRSVLGILDIQDDEAHQRIVIFRNHHARFFGLCKAPHRATGKTEGLIEALHIQRMHRVQVIRAIRT